MNPMVYLWYQTRFFFADNVMDRIIVSRDIPSENQKKLLAALLQDALVDIRHLCWHNQGEQAADLADVVHNIPTELFGIGVFHWVHLRRMFMDYKEKYPTTNGRDYVAELDSIRRSP